jgi:predicted component of viral defense system (DUF524 family)
MKTLDKLKALHLKEIELFHKIEVINAEKNKKRREIYNKYKNPLKALEKQILSIQQQINEILEK